MTYRSDEEALRTRIEQLEDELAGTRKTLAELRGDLVDPAGADAPVDRVIGVVPQLKREMQLPFEVSDNGLLAIADLLQARIPGGSAAQIGGTLTHRRASYEMRVARTRAGRTTIRLTGDYRPARVQLWLGAPGISLLGAVFAALPAAALGGGAVGITLSVLLGIAGGFYLLRALIRRAIVADQQRLSAAFQRVVEVAGEHRVSRARVAVDASADVEPEDESALEARESGSEKMRKTTH